MNNIVIFGGCGFIGLYYAEELLKVNKNINIYLADLKKPLDEFLKQKFDFLLKKQNVRYLNLDVRKSLEDINLEKIDHIADFAAIHREPGHVHSEYFNTNVNGSKNICEFANKISCKNILFASSISVYGKGEHEKTEMTNPIPNTSYGKSKLESENNYIRWQKNESKNKILTICRPGVVFGPGEKGNVTRLVKAIKKRLFIFLGNKDVKKAGIYVKELVSILHWANTNQLKKNFPRYVVFNASFIPCPNLNDYVKQICRVNKINNNFISLPKTIIKFFFIFIIIRN